jgi:hypothetical protein
MRLHVVFNPAVKSDLRAARIRRDRLEGGQVRFCDYDRHMRELAAFSRNILPDGAFVSVRFHVMEVFAAEIAFHANKFAHVRVQVLAQRDQIVSLHGAPDFCVIAHRCGEHG